ncbi:hypothetical protein ABEB36_001577 [Hypothenemus hampei]|uniref:Odorant receptor n=1 Tax=Hypothenemus hampei TaxID=57062 RepID=A0ABD1FF45_HYPHA
MHASKSIIKYNRSILYNLWKQLIVGGFLPSFKIENWILRRIYKCYVYGLRFYYMAIIALVCFELFYLLPKGDMEKVTLNMSSTIPGILIAVKIYVLKSGTTAELLNAIIEEEHKIFSCESISIRNIYCNVVTYTQNFTKIFNIMSLLTGSVILIETILSGIFIKQHKPLLILDQLSFNEFNKQNHYGTYLIIETTWIFVALLYYNLFLNYYVVLLTFVKALIRILQYKFENLKSKSRLEDFQNAKKLLHNHQSVIKLVNDVNRALKWWLLIEFALSSITIASVVIQITLADHISFVGFLVIMVLILFIQQFILAWFANDVAVESSRLAESIYSSEWYRTSADIQVFFKIAMIRSQKPLFIYLGNFKPLTIQTSLSVSLLPYVSKNGQKYFSNFIKNGKKNVKKV